MEQTKYKTARGSPTGGNGVDEATTELLEPEVSSEQLESSFHPDQRFRRPEPPDPDEIIDSRRPVSFTNIFLGFLGLLSAAPLERLFFHNPWIFVIVVIVVLISLPLLNSMRRRVFLTKKDLVIKRGRFLEFDYVVVPLRYVQWLRLEESLLDFIGRRTLVIHAPVVDLNEYRLHWIRDAEAFARQVLRHSGIGLGRLFGLDRMPDYTVDRDEGTIEHKPSPPISPENGSPKRPAHSPEDYVESEAG